jgi:hypothetical protein
MEAELRLALGIIDGDANAVCNASEDFTFNENVSAGVQSVSLAPQAGPGDSEPAGEETEETWIDVPMNIPTCNKYTTHLLTRKTSFIATTYSNQGA